MTCISCLHNLCVPKPSTAVGRIGLQHGGRIMLARTLVYVHLQLHVIWDEYRAREHYSERWNDAPTLLSLHHVPWRAPLHFRLFVSSRTSLNARTRLRTTCFFIRIFPTSFNEAPDCSKRCLPYTFLHLMPLSFISHASHILEDTDCFVTLVSFGPASWPPGLVTAVPKEASRHSPETYLRFSPTQYISSA